MRMRKSSSFFTVAFFNNACFLLNAPCGTKGWFPSSVLYINTNYTFIVEEDADVTYAETHIYFSEAQYKIKLFELMDTGDDLLTIVLACIPINLVIPSYKSKF